MLRCSALEGDDANPVGAPIGFLPNAACPVPTMQAHGGQVLQMQWPSVWVPYPWSQARERNHLGRVCAPGPARPSQPKRTRRGQACPNCCNAACLRTCTDSARPRRASVCDPILSRAQTPTATNCRAQIVFVSCCTRPGPKRRKNSMINREANTLNENVQKT